MANYVFAYSGGKGVAADEAERNAQYARWGQWFGELGSAVVDGGAAILRVHDVADAREYLAVRAALSGEVPVGEELRLEPGLRREAV